MVAKNGGEHNTRYRGVLFAFIIDRKTVYTRHALVGTPMTKFGEPALTHLKYNMYDRN
jgi:hypothetical protein